MTPSERERACFEAGVEVGALYHQFVGTPVGPETTASLERAIEDAGENRPNCGSITVDIRDDELLDAIEHDNGYTALDGSLLAVEMTVRRGETTVDATIGTTDDDSLLRIVDIESARR
ncbi:dihydroneopterin aldolase family protein (plasmid) [Haladaptatus sp. SPP-AMP-3]|uniref:dihydroneopterin aldolase family protein n=1 Tax=Haladaptatus sp. SPP-AMP-3 TaxID=3121295 RepID=UPI003C2B1616